MFENYLFGYIACSIFDPWDEELVESAGNIDSFGQIVDFFGILLLIAFVAVVFAVVSVICKGIRKRRLIDPVEDHVAIRSFDGDCKTFKRKCKKCSNGSIGHCRKMIGYGYSLRCSLLS